MDKSKPNRNRRFRFRFSLRFLFGLTVLGALGTWWLLTNIQQAKYETGLIQELTRANGTAKYTYDYQLQNGVFSERHEPKGPEFVRSLFGEHVFSRLETLTIEGDEQARLVLAGKTLPGIKHIRIINVPFMENLNGFTVLPNLESASLEYCRQLTDLSGSKSLKQLKHLEIRDCWNVERLDGLLGNQTLESFEIQCKFTGKKTSKIQWNPLETWTNLRILDVKQCDWKSFNHFKSKKKLEKVWIEDALKLETLDGLESAPNLKQLVLGNCLSLKNISALRTLEKLERLSIDSSQIRDLEDIDHLSELRSMRIDNCQDLKNLDGISNLQKLEYLNLDGCTSLTTIEGLSKLPGLKQLWVGNLHVDCDLEPTGDIPGLKTLVLSGSNCLSNTEFAKSLRLEHLKIRNCPELIKLGIVDATNMRTLELTNCPKLTSLEEIKNVNRCMVRINGCNRITEGMVKEFKEKFPLAYVLVLDSDK